MTSAFETEAGKRPVLAEAAVETPDRERLSSLSQLTATRGSPPALPKPHAPRAENSRRTESNKQGGLSVPCHDKLVELSYPTQLWSSSQHIGSDAIVAHAGFIIETSSTEVPCRARGSLYDRLSGVPCHHSRTCKPLPGATPRTARQCRPLRGGS